MTNYRQQYDLAFSPGIVGVGNALSDDFSANSPQYMLPNGTPLPGYVALDRNAWIIGSSRGPDGVGFVGVNAQMQRAEFEVITSWTDRTTAWMLKRLPPLPAYGQPPQEFAIYGSTSIASVFPQMDSDDFATSTFGYMDYWNDLVHGMYLGAGENPMAGDPWGFGWVLGQTVQMQWQDAWAGIWQTDEFGKADEYTSMYLPLVYYRARVRQKYNTPDLLYVDKYITLEFSADGSAWFPLEKTFETHIPAESAFTTYGAYVQAEPSGSVESTGLSATIGVDFLRYVVQPYDDQSTTIGGVQYLGAP